MRAGETFAVTQVGQMHIFSSTYRGFGTICGALHCRRGELWGEQLRPGQNPEMSRPQRAQKELVDLTDTGRTLAIV